MKTNVLIEFFAKFLIVLALVSMSGCSLVYTEKSINKEMVKYSKKLNASLNQVNSDLVNLGKLKAELAKTGKNNSTAQRLLIKQLPKLSEVYAEQVAQSKEVKQTQKQLRALIKGNKQVEYNSPLGQKIRSKEKLAKQQAEILREEGKKYAEQRQSLAENLAALDIHQVRFAKQHKRVMKNFSQMRKKLNKIRKKINKYTKKRLNKKPLSPEYKVLLEKKTDELLNVLTVSEKKIKATANRYNFLKRKYKNQDKLWMYPTNDIYQFKKQVEHTEEELIKLGEDGDKKNHEWNEVLNIY